jgi:hypothetical protein
MDSLLNCLSQLGLGLATNALYDLIKNLVGKRVSAQEFTREVQNEMNQHGVFVSAETVVNALTQNGFLSIQPQSAAVKVSGGGPFSGNTISIGKVTGFDQVLVFDSNGNVTNNSISIGEVAKGNKS